MSAVDLRGLHARVDRWDSLAESLQVRRVRSWRLRGTGVGMVGLLVGVLVGWVDHESVDPTPRLDAIAAAEPVLPEALPLEVNPRVERWLQAFQTTRRAEFEELLRQREVYADMIRAKLRERSMPEELIYIAMIESGLSPFAVSPVAAVGMWQFMGPTALQYGLRVDTYVDERRDPIAATDAALDYLAWLHERFGGSWYLAAAAFNAGPGRMERILNRHAEGRLSSGDAYWRVINYLPRETRDYVPKMIAVTILANEADSAGFDASDVAPYQFEHVFLPGRTSLRTVARKAGLEANVLWTLNPHLVRGVTPPGEIYGVRVPVGTSVSTVMAMSE